MNIWIGESSADAIATIGWKGIQPSLSYSTCAIEVLTFLFSAYLVFICLMAVNLVLLYFFLPEARHHCNLKEKSLTSGVDCLACYRRLMSHLKSWRDCSVTTTMLRSERKTYTFLGKQRSILKLEELFDRILMR